MRTTLLINDRIMRRLKALAAERKQTVSALVEAFLRKGLSEAAERGVRLDLPPIPTFRVREVLVNVADRDELERAMRDGP
ncbi:MAG: hypothetical protein HY701_08985 [Gemmatimonadetes bacterium]|nr:hypothetical protein [Gemmatimonadota bacterium]